MRTNHVMAIICVIFITFIMTACSTGESTDSAKESHPSINEIEEKTAVEADPMKNFGIGPIKSVTLGENIDQAMADKGKEIYDLTCTPCHRVDKKFTGPSPAGIMERRSPEWIMNMILNPEEMVQNDPAAKALLIEFNGSPMANQNLTEEQARAVLEYFRTL